MNGRNVYCVHQTVDHVIDTLYITRLLPLDTTEIREKSTQQILNTKIKRNNDFMLTACFVLGTSNIFDSIQLLLPIT